MTKDQITDLMEQIHEECQNLRGAGQKEYAHRDENAFANFERVAERLGLDPKQVLMVYMEKHLDGIHSFVQGHHSQREDVRGRINDVIVYCCLLRGMVDEEFGPYRTSDKPALGASVLPQADVPLPGSAAFGAAGEEM
jgi:hypothetical protein